MKYKIKEGNYKEFGAVWNAGNVIFTFRAKKWEIMKYCVSTNFDPSFIFAYRT